ncbi:hydrogenase small subunit [Pelosinus propionicus DSM 13327]|uniref:Hydrogenase small subunit n=2 Tax=Pelosinus TaxID=365348 RepID=A0A1I4Q5D8_9FIRM|nr:hydrogenase small subunit [Pelosinus propionicus]SFM35244.1 hydrogenase small subunit [Pelosinus propionicus DSM 13327]
MLSRREFIQLCMSATVGISLTEYLIPVMQNVFAQDKITKAPVIWLELGSCTGESVSLQNAINPSLEQLLSESLDIRYHWLVNVASGNAATQILEDTLEKEAGNFWLIIEGSVMTAANGRYNEIFMRNDQMVTGLDAVREIAAKAKYVIAVGDCAAFGGPAAAYPNPGGAKGVWEVVNRQVINVPGCPSHPDWMSGTFVHLLLYGIPQLDRYNRPLLFFGKTIHDLCQRRQQFEDGIFADFPGGTGCLYKVGCKGPVTHADCPLRQWNHSVNWPVKAGAPCIGCASPHFPDGMLPFYNHFPDVRTSFGTLNIKKISAGLVAFGIGGVGTHFAFAVVKKRIHNHYLKGTKPLETLPPETLEQAKQDLKELAKQNQALLSITPKSDAKQALRHRKWWRRKLDAFLHPKNKDGE